MKIEFNYGKKLAVLPVSAFDWLERASKLDLKVLFLLASMDTESVSLSDIAEKLASSEDISPTKRLLWILAIINGPLRANDESYEDRIKKQEQTKGLTQ
jgi:hypothetical protein